MNSKLRTQNSKRALISAFCVLISELASAPGACAATTADTYYIYLQGLVAERRNDLTTALSQYQKTVEQDPEALQVYKDLANLSLRLGRLDEALKAAEKARELAPKEPGSFLFLGKVHVVRGEVEQAVAQYEKVLDLDPHNREALLSLSMYHTPKDPPRALSYYKRLQVLEPHEAEILYRMGLLYQKQGKWKEAEDTFKRAAEEDPGAFGPRIALAELYELQKSTAAAIATYESAIALDPNNPALYIRLGNLFYLQKDPARARGYFEHARTLLPKEPSLYFWLARVAEEESRWDHAAQDIQKAYTLSKDTQFLPLLAYYLTRQNKSQEAIHWLEIARKADDKNPHVVFLLGLTYADLGRYAEAREALDKCLALNPEDIQVRFQFGVILDKLGQFEKSMEQFRSIIERDPRHASALNYLGYSYAERGLELDQAERWVLRALAGEPQNGAYQDSLGWVRFKKGQVDEAVETLEKAARLQPDPVIYDHLGQAYLAKGDAVAALETWHKALALDPKNREVRGRIKEVEKRVRPGTESRKILKRFEGNLRQIDSLTGLMRLEGKSGARKVRLHGAFFFQKPDRFRLDIWGPMALPVASFWVSEGSVVSVPSPLPEALREIQQTWLPWLPRFLSGALLQRLDKADVKVRQTGRRLVFESLDLVSEMDAHRALMDRCGPLAAHRYRLIEGLWIPTEIRLEFPKEHFQIKLEFSGLTLNELSSQDVFELPTASNAKH